MATLLFLIFTGLPPPCDDFGPQKTSGSPVPQGNFSIAWQYLLPNPSCAVSRTEAVLGSDGRIHIICGNCPTHGSHPYDEVYNPATNTWNTGQTYPNGLGVHNHSAVAIGSKIYVGGGRQGSNFTDDLTVLDLGTGIWSVAGKMPNTGIPHYYYEFASAGGKIYMFGGIKSDTIFTDETWCYDPVGNSWAAKAPMPVAKMSVSAITIGDTIFICGGSANYPSGSRSVYAYCWTNDSWFTKWDSMSTPTFWASGHIVPDTGSGFVLYIIGGQHGNNYLNSVQMKYSWATLWYIETPIGTARRSHGGSQIGCSLYVAQGWNGAGIQSLERGSVNLIGIKESKNSVATSASNLDLTISPNPFTRGAAIRLNLPYPSSIILELYDGQGRLHKKITWGYKKKGLHSYQLDRANLPDGVYFLLLKLPDKNVTRKIVITR